MLKKDAELDQLCAVDEERRKWEVKEKRSSQQLDAALKKLENINVHMHAPNAMQHERIALLKSFDL